MKIGELSRSSRVVAGIISACMLSVAVPFTGFAATDYSTKAITMADAQGHYKVQGRTGVVGTGISMDWSASGVEFNADCEGEVALNFTTQTSKTTQYFTVYVDGQKTDRMSITNSGNSIESHQLVIAADLPRGTHSFKVFRQNESLFAFATLKSIQLSGMLTAPPANNNLLVEFVGDSITAGYGNLGYINSDPGASINEDGTQSYAYLTAQNLNADYSILACSGFGVICGVGGTGAYMSKFYNYVSWLRSHTSNQADAWNFSRKADIVVVNLGTNDYFQSSTYNVTAAAFTTASKDLIKTIRGKNPNAKIVWAYGMMTTGLSSNIKDAVSQFGGETNGLYTVQLPYGNSGTLGHPDAVQQAAAATTLTDFLQTTILPTISTSSSSTSSATSSHETSSTSSNSTAASTASSTNSTSLSGSSAGSGSSETVQSSDSTMSGSSSDEVSLDSSNDSRSNSGSSLAAGSQDSISSPDPEPKGEDSSPTTLLTVLIAAAAILLAGGAAAIFLALRKKEA